MTKYHQLSESERHELYECLQNGLRQGDIARRMGRDPATISRELLRNRNKGGTYLPDTAQRRAEARRRKPKKLDKNLPLKAFVVDHLMSFGWSPEQIAGYLKTQQSELPCLSHEAIYAWIYSPPQRTEKLWCYLPRAKAKRGLRRPRRFKGTTIPYRKSIHERPLDVAFRKTFGHWEADLMVFKKSSQSILVATERKTRFILAKQLPSKTSDAVVKAEIDLFSPLPEQARRSLTKDNGGEFAKHAILKEKLGIQSFFCDPYASWQKGSTENSNGRLRRDLPRSCDVKHMKQEDFDDIIWMHNMTPRKILGFKSPAQAFFDNLNFVALQT